MTTPVRTALAAAIVALTACGNATTPVDAAGSPRSDALTDAAPADAMVPDVPDGAVADAAVADAAVADAAVADAPAADAPIADASVADAATDGPIPDATVCLGVTDAAITDAFSLYDSMPPTTTGALQLSPNVGVDPNRDVLDAKISPDGARVVFIAETEVSGVARLYSVPISGGTITTLSQNSTSDTGLDVYQFDISPDSQRVVFRGDVEVDGLVKLYSVPIDGGSVVTLSQNTVPNLNVFDFAISPTNDRVVFRGDLETYGNNLLYSTPVAGGTVTLLSHSAAQQDVMADYRFTPDGSTIVFRGGASQRLYTIGVDGGSLTEVVPANNVGNFQLSPDTQTVVFTVAKRLYAAPLGGGGPMTELSHPGTTPAIGVAQFEISSDGTRVAFRGDTEIPDVVRLYSTPICGGPIATLSHALIADPLRRVATFKLAPNGKYAVFLGDTEWSGVIRLYSVPIAGGPITTLSHTTMTDVDLDAGAFMIDPSSTRVVWLGDTEIDGYLRLYMTPLTGGAITTLSQVTAGPTQGINRRMITPAGDAVVFSGDTEVQNVRRLYWVPITGGTIQTLSPNTGPDPGLWVKLVTLSRDGSNVVFIGDVITDDVDQLYVRSLQP